MSVLECNRKGCENIMCYRYSREYGYICGECFEELKNYIQYSCPGPKACDIDFIKMFMEHTEKGSRVDYTELLEEEFRISRE